MDKRSYFFSELKKLENCRELRAKVFVKEDLEAAGWTKTSTRKPGDPGAFLFINEKLEAAGYLLVPFGE